MLQPFTATSPALDAQVLEAASRWLNDEDDVVLGCECANPALQIERWGQESAAALNA